MDQSVIEEIARRMQRLHSKEMQGTVQAWESLPPDQRSTWRLIARDTAAAIEEHARGTKRRAEPRPGEARQAP